MTPASYSLATSPTSQSLARKPCSRGRGTAERRHNIGASKCCSELQTPETWQKEVGAFEWKRASRRSALVGG